MHFNRTAVDIAFYCKPDIAAGVYGCMGVAVSHHADGVRNIARQQLRRRGTETQEKQHPDSS